MIVSLRCDCAFFLEKLEIIMCRLWRPECVARHCDDMADVARCYLEESGQLGELPAHLQNYIDYAAYGRDMELEGTFVVTNHGVYEILR